MARCVIAKWLQSDWVGPASASLAVVIGISVFRPSFLSALNIFVLVSAISINMLVALSQLVILSIGQMNLAVGAIGGLAAISFAGLMELYGLPPLVAAFAGLALGAGLGATSGYVIGRTGISAFIVTLAGLQIFKGINTGLTQAQPFYAVPQSVKDFGNTAMIGILPWLAVPAIVGSVAIGLLFNRLRIGRSMLAVGGNSSAAELSGIDARSTVVWAHALSGALAAAAGMLMVARLQIGAPAIGDDWLISSFAGPILGGAVLTGGHISVPATFFGVAIIAIITQALVLFAIDPFAVQIVLGSLILLAVGVNRLREARLSPTARTVD